MKRTLGQFFLLSILCSGLNAAPPLPALPDAEPAAEEAEALPVFSLRTVPSVILDAQLKSIRRYQRFASCKVAPLDEIWDPEVLAFEEKADTDPANLDGLTPDAAQALDALKEMVTSLGGRFDLKSAYRPTAYQAHLHEVWMKWKQLRGNRSSGCRALREEVGAEFARHQLLIRQQPVPASDHALGLAFDAAVAMPRGARLNGKRVTVDKLAAVAGIRRPNSRRDPVHFKVLVDRPAVSVLRAD